MLHAIGKSYSHVFVYEEVAGSGTLYHNIIQFMAEHHYQPNMSSMSITNKVVEHGHYKDMLKKLQMDLETVKSHLERFIS